MLKTITGNPYAMSLLGAALVLIGDGAGATPEAVCCPTCGALLTCLMTLAAKAGTPNGSSQRPAG